MICTCGNDKFYANMNATVKVLVDEDGDWIGALGDKVTLESNGPTEEPYICTKCDKEYSDYEFKEYEENEECDD